MFIQFRHVEANEAFEFQEKRYTKTNYSRGRQKNTFTPKPTFRRFKPSDIVKTDTKSTPENQWMEVK